MATSVPQALAGVAGADQRGQAGAIATSFAEALDGILPERARSGQSKQQAGAIAEIAPDGAAPVVLPPPVQAAPVQITPVAADPQLAVPLPAATPEASPGSQEAPSGSQDASAPALQPAGSARPEGPAVAPVATPVPGLPEAGTEATAIPPAAVASTPQAETAIEATPAGPSAAAGTGSPAQNRVADQTQVPQAIASGGTGVEDRTVAPVAARTGEPLAPDGEAAPEAAGPVDADQTRPAPRQATGQATARTGVPTGGQADPVKAEDRPQGPQPAPAAGGPAALSAGQTRPTVEAAEAGRPAGAAVPPAPQAATGTAGAGAGTEHGETAPSAVPVAAGADTDRAGSPQGSDAQGAAAQGGANVNAVKPAADRHSRGDRDGTDDRGFGRREAAGDRQAAQAQPVPGPSAAQAPLPAPVAPSAETGPMTQFVPIVGAPGPQMLAAEVAQRVAAQTHAPGSTVPIHGLAIAVAARAAAGSTRFDIRLDPPELGRIEVQLILDREGSVRSKMVVEKQETLDLLQRDQRNLERALAQSGVETKEGSIEFSLRDQGGHGRERPQAETTRFWQVRETADDAPNGAVLSADIQSRLAALRGGVDIRI